MVVLAGKSNQGKRVGRQWRHRQDAFDAAKMSIVDVRVLGDIKYHSDLAPPAEWNNNELSGYRSQAGEPIVEQQIYRAIERDSCDGHDLLAGNTGRLRKPVPFI